MELENLEKEYKKYKWFYTSSGKLVIGGKSAEQNDSLLTSIKKSNKEFIVMHTAEPGSPFTIILSDIKKVSKSDLAECAIFTGCFSRAWKAGRKKTSVSVFKASQIHKEKGMNVGTWGVLGKTDKMSVVLELVLTKQKGLLRAVPEKSVKSKKEILLKIVPGSIDKKDMLPKLQVDLSESYGQDEVLSALPAGGLRIIK